MKDFSRLRDWVVLGCLLLAIFSALVFLPMAQSGQDQNEATATLNLTANYTADFKSQNRDEVCEDHLTLTYGGTARYKLLPGGYGTSNVHPEILSSAPAAHVQADKAGSFTVNVQGGGNCVNTKGGGKRVWTYGARYTAVPPNEFPSIGVQLRPGDYRVGYEFPESVITAQAQILPGGRDFGSPGGAPLDTKQRPNAVAPAPPSISYQARGPAMFPLLAVMQQSVPKVSAALHGSFTPYSKEFSRSNSVSDTFQMPPNNDGQTGTASLNIFYTLTVGNPEEVEAIIIPQKGYQDWLPEGGKDESADGNRLDVTVELQKKGQRNVKPAQGATFKFELVKVTKEPGVCLNWPPKSRVIDPPDFDLKIDKNNPYFDSSLQNNPAQDGQSATSKRKLKKVELNIVSHDYGAWGQLKVTATLEDGTPVAVHVEDKPDIKVLTIPKDDNGNRIADAWKDRFGLEGSSRSETSDEDSEPDTGPGHTGDGLSLYEEYRGFRIQGAHTRLNPRKKDVFIRNRGELPVDLFKKSGLTMHLIAKDEYARDDSTPNPAYVNFNTSGFAHLQPNVHVLRLINRNLSGLLSDLGVVLGATGDLNGQPIGLPKNVRGGWVRVDKAACLNSSMEWGEAELESTTAHELAHGCNVKHHGRGNYLILGVCVSYLDNPLPPEQQTQLYEVSAPGGQNSGDENCIMRYEGSKFTQAADPAEEANSPYSWKLRGSILNGLVMCGGKSLQGDKYGKLAPPGTLFCNTDAGPPFPRGGKAGEGKCQQQFDVNDTH
jgi:hypothetical protein